MGMIKTIKVKKEFNFRELMEYILENDIRDRVFRCRLDEHKFSVCEDGIFEFYCENYDMGEIYEIEVEQEIKHNTIFTHLVEVDKYNTVFKLTRMSINEIKDEDTKTIYIPIDGELVKIWERE